MKLNQLSKSTKLNYTLKEAINTIDTNAKEELDGVEDIENVDIDDVNLDTDEIDSEIEDQEIEDPEIEDPEIENQEIENQEIENQEIENQDGSKTASGYSLKNVNDQLEGMVNKWFKLAQNYEGDQREAFLKLGDRLSEISDVLESEFIES
jgi:hypothetical protein